MFRHYFEDALHGGPAGQQSGGGSSQQPMARTFALSMTCECGLVEIEAIAIAALAIRNVSASFFMVVLSKPGLPSLLYRLTNVSAATPRGKSRRAANPPP